MENASSFNKILHDARMDASRRHAEWKEQRREREKANAAIMARARAQLFPCLQRATVSEYRSWLAGYIKNGGLSTHCYDYRMPSCFMVAKRDFKTIPLYGSQAVEIIVPVGIDVFDDGLGHCNLYLMDGFKVVGGWVPVYSDILDSPYRPPVNGGREEARMHEPSRRQS